jgi:hypothetical protein
LWPTLVALDNSLEDLQETYRLLLPGKDVQGMMFTSGGASDANNDYVGRSAKISGWPALYYSSPDQSADEVEAKIREGGFLGIISELEGKLIVASFIKDPKRIAAIAQIILDHGEKLQRGNGAFDVLENTFQ